jgi:hypothetical protein
MADGSGAVVAGVGTVVTTSSCTSCIDGFVFKVKKKQSSRAEVVLVVCGRKAKLQAFVRS